MGKVIHTERNYGIDLLRIVSMYMVVVLHLIGGDTILEYFSLCSLEYELAWLLELIAFPAVNCYALISGYVAIEAKQRYSSIAILWLQVFLYSALISILFAVMFPASINTSDVVAGFFPVLTTQYWYFTAYVGLFFLMPALRIVVEKASQKELKQLLIIGFVLFSVCPMLTNTDIFVTADGYSMLWLGYLFLLGAYVKKYSPFEKIRTRWLWMIFAGCVILTLGVKFVIEHISWNRLETLFLCNCLTKYTSPLILIEALAIFAIFARMKLSEKAKGGVRVVAPLSFGVYLIHNHDKIRNAVILPLQAKLYQNSILGFLAGVLLSAAGIFVVCILIDYVRMQLFKALKIKEKLSIIDKHFL